MINDYSQYGEGKIIADYFGDFKGALLSLGENDGKTLSNALGLIEQGWNAHLIEPSPEAYKKLRLLHKGNKQVRTYKVAIGESNGTVKFYHSGTHLNTGDTSLLSTIDPEELKRWKGTCEFKEIEVDCLTFETFIERSGIKNVAFISIDCEGLDYFILTQIDFKALGVKMVCVEHNSQETQKYIDYMANLGYTVHFKNYCNLIFVCK